MFYTAPEVLQWFDKDKDGTVTFQEWSRRTACGRRFCQRREDGSLRLLTVFGAQPPLKPKSVSVNATVRALTRCHTLMELPKTANFQLSGVPPNVLEQVRLRRIAAPLVRCQRREKRKANLRRKQRITPCQYQLC